MSEEVEVPGELPSLYKAALAALEQCLEQIGVPWDDPVEELAAMAKMSDDETLIKLTLRIRRRAIRGKARMKREIAAQLAPPAPTPDEWASSAIAESKERLSASGSAPGSSSGGGDTGPRGA